MKKSFCIVGFLVLAAQLPLWGYDTSPSIFQVVPEAIWAAATGGGTWITELQITNMGPAAAWITIYFDTAAGHDVYPVSIGPISALKSVKYSNILATMDALDPTSQVYYGKVGALLLGAEPNRIQVQAQTVNGNYGKTFPGLNPVAGTTAAISRPMMVQGLVSNATYRTFIGIYNYGQPCTVRFTIFNAANGTVGSSFERTLTVCGYSTFNPFVQAAAPAGDYDNCYLYIEVTAGGDLTWGPLILGSIANNFTNDTYALMAKQYGGSPTVTAPPIRY
ncbi:MAG: hypothetical protein OEW05_07330 [Candidatus Aminicenantes bacterium]|nr:hypothetical protein [Candidatus Aminicenantes bacterium]